MVQISYITFENLENTLETLCFDVNYYNLKGQTYMMMSKRKKEGVHKKILNINRHTKM